MDHPLKNDSAAPTIGKKCEKKKAHGTHVDATTLMVQCVNVFLFRKHTNPHFH